MANVKSGWSGSWNAGKTVFTGKYTFDDGDTFDGEAAWTEHHVMVHSWPGMGEKRVEMPATPHWQFTGAWSPPSGRMPPPPERD